MARWLPLLLLARAAHAYTDPAEVLKLLALRDELMKPEHGIAYLLGSWKWCAVPRWRACTHSTRSLTPSLQPR